MPKEVFIKPRLVPIAVEDQTSVSAGANHDHRLEVCWGRGRFIEVATFEADPLDPLAGANQVWIELDRADCNRLIRALRKARDQAYGSDA